jgi:Mor family transcriptional regulator
VNLEVLDKEQDSCSEFESWFIDTFDFNSWLLLCSLFGGRRVYVPSHPSVEQRNRQIKNEYDTIINSDSEVKQELIYQSLADRYCLSVSQIRRVLF